MGWRELYDNKADTTKTISRLLSDLLSGLLSDLPFLFHRQHIRVSATVIENNERRSERLSVCWDFSAIDQTTLNVPLSQKVNV